MTRLNLRFPQSRPLLVLSLITAFLLRHTTSAQETAAVHEKQTRAERISDAEIEWGSLGFHGGPRLIGENAIMVYRGSVAQAPDLMKKLDDEQSFVAAHVLLTDLWRVPQRGKNSFSHPLSDGFFVCYNGLFVRIKWEEVGGKEKKTAIIADLECQKKRIREFWKMRLKEHPEEFLPETKFEEK